MIVDVDRHGPFSLDAGFLEPYPERPVPWGFGALSWATFKRSYSRDGEAWWETCRRVIEGMFTVQRAHGLQQGLAWNEGRARKDAEEAYRRLWQFKWTPPGRGLWIMGTRFMYERGGAALNNCGFVSTADIDQDYPAPFLWMLEMSMLGVGVGFDTRGKGKVTIRQPERDETPHVVADSREGWSEALERLLRAFTGQGALPQRWDLSQIRPPGSPLKSFGGYASGPEPLRKMLHDLESLYAARAGEKVDAALIVDTMNMIGRCVVAGGIRRSAQIAFGEPDDTSFLDLKQDKEKLYAYRWVSNNSIFAEVGMDYTEAARRTVFNGEPGYLWLENARVYGRMKDPANGADQAAMGSNPCVEQTLWNHELCCLVETYPAHHESYEDYRETLRLAYQYAKTVTLVPTENPRTNDVMLRNRRIGCSMTGVVQAITRLGAETFYRWCEAGYQAVQELDAVYADAWQVPRSIKTTSVKPSGTVSLLAGATPGVHWAHAPYYIRRVRVAEHHPLAELCRKAGYPVEPDAYSDQSLVISFPVRTPHVERGKAAVPLRQKVELAVRMQRHWSDNQVSCTAEFDPATERDEVRRVLADYDAHLKSLVFLPSTGHGYEQPPYETIDERTYRDMRARLKPLEGEVPHEEQLEARFCEGDACEVPFH